MRPLTVASVVATESGQGAVWASDAPIGPSEANVDKVVRPLFPPRTPEPIR